MPSGEASGILHPLDEKAIVGLLRLIIAVVAIVSLALVYLLVEFRGLSSAAGIDQAQIARELARGHGFATKNLEPLSVHWLQPVSNQWPPQNFPDLFQAPLGPLVNAAALFLAGAQLNQRIDSMHPIYMGDRIIAAVGVVFFLLALILNFRTALLLFDERIAWLTTTITTLAGLYWQFALSGQPQMLMLFLFSCAAWSLAHAIKAQLEERRSYGWLALAGMCLGLLALAHPLTLFISTGAAIFSWSYFKPRPVGGILLVVICLGLFSIWVIRDYQISKTPFGTSQFACLDNIVHGELGWLRQGDPDLSGINFFAFKTRTVENFTSQLGSLYLLLGGIAVAPGFFLSLLHPFKRSETNVFKWLLFLMWLGAFAGSVLTTNGSDQMSAGQILVLFGPAMAIYGFALLLVFWYRLGIDSWVLRRTFYLVLLLTTAIPAIGDFHGLASDPPMQYPPYLPELIQAFKDWTQPNEIVASDMSWAVAWYADRQSLLLPFHRKDFLDYHKSESLGAPIVGLYLTPISGDRPYLTDIAEGDYADWRGLIERRPDALNDFPLKAAYAFANNACLLLMDRPRWLNQ